MTLTEQRNALSELIAACWNDNEFKERFINDPKSVLADYGMEVPEGVDIKVVENTDSVVHIVLPAANASDHADLSDPMVAFNLFTPDRQYRLDTCACMFGVTSDC